MYSLSHPDFLGQSTGNDRYSGDRYSGNDGYSGLKTPDVAILFTFSGITVIADKKVGNFNTKMPFFYAN